MLHDIRFSSHIAIVSYRIVLVFQRYDIHDKWYIWYDIYDKWYLNERDYFQFQDLTIIVIYHEISFNQETSNLSNLKLNNWKKIQKRAQILVFLQYFWHDIFFIVIRSYQYPMKKKSRSFFFFKTFSWVWDVPIWILISI